MQLEDYFCSDSFISEIKVLYPNLDIYSKESKIDIIDITTYIIDMCFKYYIIFKENDNINLNELTYTLKKAIEYIDYLLKNDSSKSRKTIIDYFEQYQLQLFEETLIHKLNIPKNYLSNKALTNKLYEYIINKILGTSYIFHSFNSVFFESIKKNGLNPNIMFTPQNELDEIYNLFQKHGYDYIIGFQKINCEGQISYSNLPFFIYLYAIRSPEWFNYFTDSRINMFSQALTSLDLSNKKEEEHCSDTSIQTFTPDCHITNNYKGAKQNIENLIKKLDFTSKEKDFTLSFLEKNWQIYANREPMVAIITKKKTNKDLTKITANILENYNISSISDLINICFNTLKIDCQTTKIIDTSNAKFIKLPSYKYLKEKILQEKKENIKSLKKRVGRN